MTEEAREVTGGFEDWFETPSLDTPVGDADAHQAVITGVRLDRYDSGASAIVLSMNSLDDPAVAEQVYKIFVPRAFADDIYVDPAQLASVPEEGKKQSEQQSYGRNIRNKQGTAELQKLQKIAFDQGRNVQSLGLSRPSTLDELVANLGAILANVQIVFARRPNMDEENPQYYGRLEVRNIYGPDVISNPKALRKYHRAWEG